MKRVSGKRLCQILKKRGWILQRINGSHHIFRHPDFPDPISVPVHGNQDLRIGTQLGIMKDAGLSEKDLT